MGLKNQINEETLTVKLKVVSSGNYGDSEDKLNLKVSIRKLNIEYKQNFKENVTEFK